MAVSISELTKIPIQFNTWENFRSIGLIVLATDLTSEHDFITMCSHPQVRLHVTRTTFSNPVTPENLKAMEEGLEHSASLLTPGMKLDAVYFSCTSASALLGDTTVTKKIQAAKGEVPVVTPLSAAARAFKELGALKLSVLTPYTEDVARPVGGYFGKQGFKVLNISYMGLTDDTEMARITPESIIAAAREAISAEADALFISCTALRSAQIATLIEKEIGKPVVTSNQAAAWRVLDLIRIPPNVSGCGKLMSSSII